MSELTIDLYDGLKVIVDDGPSDPHVIIEGAGERLRIDAPDVRRLADVLTGASVMMEPEPLVASQWLGTGGYPTVQGANGD